MGELIVSTTITTITGAMAFAGATFGQSSGEIFFGGVECNGTESLLDECSDSRSGSAELPLDDTVDCNHTSVVGIRCKGKVYCFLLED